MKKQPKYTQKTSRNSQFNIEVTNHSIHDTHVRGSVPIANSWRHNRALHGFRRRPGGTPMSLSALRPGRSEGGCRGQLSAAGGRPRTPGGTDPFPARPNPSSLGRAGPGTSRRGRRLAGARTAFKDPIRKAPRPKGPRLRPAHLAPDARRRERRSGSRFCAVVISLPRVRHHADGNAAGTRRRIWSLAGSSEASGRRMARCVGIPGSAHLTPLFFANPVTRAKPARRRDRRFADQARVAGGGPSGQADRRRAPR